jgi:tetratricopeptide (TPR) repeat protein
VYELFKINSTALSTATRFNTMASIIPGYEYDIFISYRQKDNKYDGWVTEFVDHLKRELEATFKEEISVYFDINPHDGLLETYDINASLKDKLKCLIFVPVISQTYCDIKSFAWLNEFCTFNKFAKTDKLGRDIKLINGNVASRILPVKIHDIDKEDKTLLENELGGVLRAVDFIYTEPGINRPLKPNDNKNENQNKTDYRNQLNKLANAIKEIIGSMKNPSTVNSMPVVIITSQQKNLTANPEAYKWFKKAEFRLTPEDNFDIDSCIQFLKKAISADASFALAHAELSRAYSFKNYFIDPNGRYDEEAYVEAEKSLFLNPDLAEGFFAKAYGTWTFQNKFPHEKVIREYKKAISIKPDLDEAYHYLGVVYMHLGLTKESLEVIRKAMKINPDNKVASLDLISCYYFGGTKKDLLRVVDLFKQTPDHLISPMRASYWAITLITLDRFAEAEKILSDGINKKLSDLFINSAMAILLAKKGDRTGALERIEYCEQNNLNTGHSHHAVYNLAVAYGLLDSLQISVDKLTWVAENGFPNYTFFRDDPLLISLHQFPPYNELLKKLKVSWEKFSQIANE